MSTGEVVDSRDGCRHSFAESTVDVPIRLFTQIFSARNPFRVYSLGFRV